MKIHQKIKLETYKHIHVKPKIVPIFPIQEAGERCPINILDKYIEKLCILMPYVGMSQVLKRLSTTLNMNKLSVTDDYIEGKSVYGDCNYFIWAFKCIRMQYV